MYRQDFALNNLEVLIYRKIINQVTIHHYLDKIVDD